MIDWKERQAREDEQGGDRNGQPCHPSRTERGGISQCSDALPSFEKSFATLRMTIQEWNLTLVCQCRLNKAFEERVRLIRFALKLGMILAGQEVGMIAQLDQFGERTIG